jgi:hypothetical protein
MPELDSAAVTTYSTELPPDLLEDGVPSPAAAGDAERFQKLMSTEGTPDVDSMTPIARGAGTLGDAILSKMNAVGKNYQKTAAEFNDSAIDGTSALGLSAMLRLQGRMIQVSLEIDVVSKGIAKGLQHVDQLTKLQ